MVTGLTKISDAALELLKKDAQLRIGMHMEGEYILEDYITKQQNIVQSVCEEQEKRINQQVNQ